MPIHTSDNYNNLIMVQAIYRHTNLIAKDWQKLSHFYQVVFGCIPVPPKRKLSGKWLEEGTNVTQAFLEGEHLRLPGFLNDEGPTLEIFTYSDVKENLEVAANRKGFGHIAFEVDSIEECLETVLKNGGKTYGKIVSREIPDVGVLTFVYVLDPEENLIELQSWR